MCAGKRNACRLGLSGLGCALLCAAAIGVAPAVAGGARPQPPTAAAFARATDELLARPFPAAHRTAPAQAAGGGGIGVGGGSGGGLFPRKRMVALYGAPQLSSTALGSRRPGAAARKIERQARPYASQGDRRVIEAFDLIAVVATASKGADGKYRSRQPDKLIAKYLRRVRSFNGRLVLDIQPGRSTVLREMKALREWIAQPDVDVAIDPEWNVGPRGVPGQTEGSITADELNAASRRLSGIVKAKHLPAKALIIHQFRRGSIRHRPDLHRRPNVDVTLNFDGIGSPRAKRAGYRSLSAPGSFNGFSLFYDLDTRLMKPSAVLGLDPEADYVMYQ